MHLTLYFLSSIYCFSEDIVILYKAAQLYNITITMSTAYINKCSKFGRNVGLSLKRLASVSNIFDTNVAPGSSAFYSDLINVCILLLCFVIILIF